MQSYNIEANIALVCLLTILLYNSTRILWEDIGFRQEQNFVTNQQTEIECRANSFKVQVYLLHQ